MKLLSDILYRVPITSVYGATDILISSVQFDSRKVNQDDLFVAVKGTESDGHRFIMDSIARGATVVVCEDIPDSVKSFSGEVTFIQVLNSSASLGHIANNFYDNPSQKLKLIGITGTNGKTTCATLCYLLFRKLGYKTGLLSTIENRINEEIIETTHTTLDPVELNKLLADMVIKECNFCFMEVSSHAIVQKRIEGLFFAGGVFTNITHDHLDFHKTFDNYLKAKQLFFDTLPKQSFCLINNDDIHGRIIEQNTKAKRYSYSLKNPSDFKARIIENSLDGLQLEIDNKQVWFKFNGIFNGYNLVAVYSIAIILGESIEEALKHLSSLSPVRGRFEKIVSKSNIIGIVDYAHTPDALHNVLDTIQEIRKGNEKVTTVVGCGGNRDSLKRSSMAEIAVLLSDKVILTSDNPRNEDPHEIIAQMHKGIQIADLKKTLTISNREEAIKVACTMAEPGDIILVAGKGHEVYQEIYGVKYPFDDREMILKYFKMLDK